MRVIICDICETKIITPNLITVLIKEGNIEKLSAELCAKCCKTVIQTIKSKSK